MIALAVLRRDTPVCDPETELVDVERQGNRLQLMLDDGQVLEFDVWELISAAAGATAESPELRAA